MVTFLFSSSVSSSDRLSVDFRCLHENTVRCLQSNRYKKLQGNISKATSLDKHWRKKLLEITSLHRKGTINSPNTTITSIDFSWCLLVDWDQHSTYRSLVLYMRCYLNKVCVSGDSLELFLHNFVKYSFFVFKMFINV